LGEFHVRIFAAFMRVPVCNLAAKARFYAQLLLAGLRDILSLFGVLLLQILSACCPQSSSQGSKNTCGAFITRREAGIKSSSVKERRIQQ
jgi:hypothetical protein